MQNTLDARGLMCPKPVILTKQELAKMEQGQLIVLVDNTTAVSNIEAYAGAEGLTVHTEQRGADFAVIIQKTGVALAADAAAAPVVVLISGKEFGSGDTQFGETLMRNFIFALTEAEPKPATMLFVNHGAYFTCQGSPVLESLQALSEAGVEILTCGACLDFYALKESLAIGQVTNMYTMTEKMLRAGHVIKM